MVDVMAQRPKYLIEQEGKGELQKGSEATQRNGEKRTLHKSTVEATSLGLKTKSGLRPNSRKYRGFIYKWIPVLKIDPRIQATRKCGSMK